MCKTANVGFRASDTSSKSPSHTIQKADSIYYLIQPAQINSKVAEGLTL